MSWSKKLPEPIRLRDGRELLTLSDARPLMLGLAESRQHRPTWAYAVELLLEAAETGKRADIADAWAQISRAAFADGMKARALMQSGQEAREAWRENDQNALVALR